MTLHTSPIPARTDVLPIAAPPTRSTARIRVSGGVLAAGAAAWGVGMMTVGVTSGLVAMLTALAFQVGLLGLLHVQRVTGAIGTGRLARTAFVVEHVLVAGAVVNTLFDNDGSLFLTICDICWPLSMLGMAAIAVRIAVTGRWLGVLRGWPLVAETWAFVAIPAAAVVPQHAGVVAGAHALVGYATLGVLLALRPDLTR